MKQIINRIKYGKIKRDLNTNDYKSFSSEEQIAKWINYYKSWAIKYNNAFKEINYSNGSFGEDTSFNLKISDPIKDYCGYYAQKINFYLRNNKFDISSENRTKIFIEIALLRREIYVSPRIPQNIVVYRMVPPEFTSKLISNNKKLVPVPTKEKGFMSTSLLEDIYKDDNYKSYDMLKIHVSKHYFALCATIISPGENEMIFPPNCFLRLIDYPYEKNGHEIFPCQLIEFF